MTDDSIVTYLKALQTKIISTFESIETSGQFEREEWTYKKGHGGGEMAILRGEVFEKAAVNWSGVGGDRFPGSDDDSPFFATGVSVIAHMRNPKMPTVHFNIRSIERKKDSSDSKEMEHWFGGGFDLTPMGFRFEDDTFHFHAAAKDALDPHGPDLYPKFSQAAKEYFFIKHYNRERGVGGIFFDHYSTGDYEKDLSMWKSVGDGFLNSIMPIYKKRIDEKYTKDDRLTQLKARAHYVEYNLLYDRGTKFGFQSGGNPKAILCSMPPLAAW